MKIIIGLFVVFAAVSGQTCPSWSSMNTNLGVDDPGMVGGGAWSSGDFPRDPLWVNGEQVTNQNFSEIISKPSGYVYIDHQDPQGQQKFDTIWAPQNMSMKLREYPAIRPAGYKYAYIRAFNKKVPCIRVYGVQGHGLEIAVYAEEDHKICIRDKQNAATASINNQADTAFQKICGQQRVKHCFVTPSGATHSSFNFEIYADTPYELTNGFGVFYRLRRSRFAYVQSGNNARSATTEMWCMMLNGIDWPEFTGATPENGLNIPATNSASVASILAGSFFAFVAALVM